jgi:hypothetical protein
LKGNAMAMATMRCIDQHRDASPSSRAGMGTGPDASPFVATHIGSSMPASLLIAGRHGDRRAGTGTGPYRCDVMAIRRAIMVAYRLLYSVYAHYTNAINSFAYLGVASRMNTWSMF